MAASSPHAALMEYTPMLKDWRFWFVVPTVLALRTVVFFPSGYLLWMSVSHWVVTEPGVYFDGAANFSNLFKSAEFYSALWVTAIYLVLSTVLMLALAFTFALALSRPGTPGMLRA